MGLLDGKVAIITGAGNGIGRAEALLFAREGARVVVNDTGSALDGTGSDPSVAERVRDEIIAAGGDAIANHDSVATMEGAARIVRSAVDAFGGVDVLVNNAGIVRDRSVLKMDEAAFDAVIAVHLRGAFNMCQTAVRRMIEQKRGGRIVNTVAHAGLLGNLGQLNYSAANAGVLGLTRTLAIELRKHDIRVNALAPVARTRMTEHLPLFHAMPDAHFGPQFVAPAALFLASSLADDLSGETLAVAGSKLSVFRVAESRGVLGDDPEAPWTAAQIRAQWDSIVR
jgi:NAD(P)-dependent dehydrogenase (short-subunit alcohol dehydrogenase family)